MTRLLLLCCLGASPLAAQEVYRCEDAQGQRVFSDQPCRVIGVLPLPSERDPVPVPGPAEATDAMPPAEALEDLSPPAAAGGCPGPDPEQLGKALADAALRGDLNAIAGMVYWPAAGRGATRSVFARAQQLSLRAPLAVLVETPKADDSWLWQGLPPPEPRAAPPELAITSAANPDALLARFSLTRQAGCWWLMP
jgi:hypothetical protein